MRKILLLLSMAALVTACGRIGGEKDTPRETRVGWTVAQHGEFGGIHEYVGTLQEAYSTRLCFEAGGRVTRVYVREGQHVKEGQLLAAIDNTTARNSYNAAKAALDRAQDGYDRAEKVYQKGSLPEVKWIEVVTQLSQAQSMEEVARKKLEDCELRAPVSGTISDKDMEVGSTVSPLVPVVNIVGMEGMFVSVGIPEVDINKVTIGSTAKVAVGAMGDTLYEGVVEERNVNADQLSHSYMVRIRLKGRTKGLLPGMVCRVRLDGERSEGRIELPSRAVQLDNDGSRYVWVVKNGKAQKQVVSIDNLARTGVLIGQGLSNGDTVITDGTQKVASGCRVICE